MYSRREYFEYSCKRLKLAQVLGQLRVFLTTRAARSPHTQSHPAQRSVQHPMQDYGVPARSHSRLNAQCNTRERCQVGPKDASRPMHSRREYYKYSCKRLKLAQVLGQLRVFLTTPRAAASPHAVTSSSKISATPHAGLRRPHTQSRPGQGSDVQHPEQDCGVPTRNHSRLKDQCNTPCRTTASPHAITAGSRLSATPHAGLWRPHTQSRPGQGSVQHRIRDRTSVHVRMYCTKFSTIICTCDPDDTHDGHACPDTYLSI